MRERELNAAAGRGAPVREGFSGAGDAALTAACLLDGLPTSLLRDGNCLPAGF